MRSKFTIFLLAFFLFVFVSARETLAIYNPLDHENNKFGIHILNENDIEGADLLVNSNGGEWGYVTLVIRKDERNIDRWQRVFDELRRRRLIPIVRIATNQTPFGWEKFKTEDIKNWVYFLNSLNWVIENRYVIIGNEPNHATEWQGEVNPEEYSDYLNVISRELKAASDDFFVIPAGMDASAPNGRFYMDEKEFLSRMIDRNPDIFENIDGWSSHSYPNPGFSGSAKDTGRGTINTFSWELELLKSLGIEKELPVFITETGWIHNKKIEQSSLLGPKVVAENLEYAFKNVWNDDRIVAVTPFLLSYNEPPFDIFSWRANDGGYYDFYYKIQEIKKNAGKPIQSSSGEIKSIEITDQLDNSKKITGYAIIENTGQDIWERADVNIGNDGDIINIFTSKNTESIEPGQKSIIFFSIIPDKSFFEDKQIIFKIYKDNFPISDGYRIQLPSRYDAISFRGTSIESPKYLQTRTVIPVIIFAGDTGEYRASI